MKHAPSTNATINVMGPMLMAASPRRNAYPNDAPGEVYHETRWLAVINRAQDWNGLARRGFGGEKKRRSGRLSETNLPPRH